MLLAGRKDFLNNPASEKKKIGRKQWIHGRKTVLIQQKKSSFSHQENEFCGNLRYFVNVEITGKTPQSHLR